MLLFLLVFFVSLFFLGRSVLIIMGLYKDPVIKTFEHYGPEEKMYLPLIPLLFWSGVFLFTLGTLLSVYTRLTFPLIALALISIILSAVGYQNTDLAVRWNYGLFKYPHWLHELRERTTRYERRRIAYMWLTLPKRLRLIYNSADRWFFLWADFVIMGTITDEEDPAMEKA